MKALVQRTSSADVKVGNTVVGKISHGLVVFVGVMSGDDQNDISYIAKKLVNLRIFSNQSGKFDLSVKDIEGSILLVSQFTLAGDTRKGNRPSFHLAAPPDEAKAIFDQLVTAIEAYDVRVQQGCFGENMRVSLINEGPVTLMLESR